MIEPSKLFVNHVLVALNGSRKIVDSFGIDRDV